MELPRDPVTGPDPADDDFDFSPGATGLPPHLAQQLRDAAESLSAMGAEQRRHVAIALTAIGATWLAPAIAARRRRKRRRRRST